MSSSFSEFFQQSFIPYMYTYMIRGEKYIRVHVGYKGLYTSHLLPSAPLSHCNLSQHDTLFGKSLGKILHSLSLPSAGWTRWSPAQIQLECSH